jgi:hypothetical protein
MVAQSLARTKAEDPHARVEWLLKYVRLKQVLNLFSLLENIYPPTITATCVFLSTRPTRFKRDFDDYSFHFGHTFCALRVNFGTKTYFKCLQHIASKIYHSRLAHSVSSGDRKMNSSAIMGAVFFLDQDVQKKEQPIYPVGLEIEDGGSVTHISPSFLNGPIEPTKTNVYIHWSANIVQQPQQSSDSVNIYNLSQEHISNIVSRKNSHHTSSREDNKCAEAEIEVVTMLNEQYDYCESHTLKKIDGFLVTDGKTKPRITLKDSLSHGEKQRGRLALGQYVAAKAKPGVYLWRTTD